MVDGWLLQHGYAFGTQRAKVNETEVKRMKNAKNAWKMGA